MLFLCKHTYQLEIYFLLRETSDDNLRGLWAIKKSKIKFA